MTQQPPRGGGLALLAEAFRSRRTGLLVVGEEPTLLRVKLEAGQIVALGPAPAEATVATPLPKPNDSVRLRLERVLSEIGMRKAQPSLDPVPSTPATLRDRLIERLTDESLSSHFEEASETPHDLVAVAVATEPLILEAVRQMRGDDAVRAALGDLDQRLIATSAMADERTLTLTEGYLLSRIDGLLSARAVLQLVPLDPQETERTLLGLLLTGRVAGKPAAAQRPAAQPVEAVSPEAAAEAAPIVEPFPVAEPDPADEPERVAEPEPVAPAGAEPGLEPLAATAAEDQVTGSADDPIVEAIPDESPEPVVAEDTPTGPLPVQTSPLPVPPPPPPAKPAAQPIDPAVIARRRDILEFFQALPLKNHFEVLGVEPGCSDADARRAYVALVKRYHPDSQRDARLEDLHDILEAITIRVGEAWEVLGEARSRASYESRSGIVRRTTSTTTWTTTQGHPAARAPVPPPPPPAAPEPGEYVPPEEILFRARRLLSQARYWDVIQMLESALPGMEPRSQQHRGRLLLARAYSKNPNWLRRAEEMLQGLVREDPTNADGYFELGLLYKTGGFMARAQSMFRRALELRPGHKEASAELGIQAAAPEGGGGLLKRLFKRGAS